MRLTFQEQIEHEIESGFQAIYVNTAERSRCEAELATVADKLSMNFVTWDAISGFTNYNGSKNNNECKDAIEALVSMGQDGEDSECMWQGMDVMFVMRNFHVFMAEASVRQQFQNLYYGRKMSSRDYKRPIIIVANALDIHPEIAPCITLAEFSLPNEHELTAVFKDVTDNIEVDETRPGAIATCDEDMQGRIVQAMRGLTTLEAENILAYSLRANRGFAPPIVDTIEDQKAMVLEKSDVLTYVPKERIASMDEIGGYEELKDFIAIRKLAYTKQAKELKLDLPKGIVLLGTPGTGKSVVSKVLARELGLPLVILDVSAVFGSLVGESEGRIRTALNVVDALDGSVLLVDEAEKGLGGADQSTGDSGVSRRVFGVLLTWLTEKRSRTFVVMTMNRVAGIPPEFLRRGRFDQIFYTDIPDAVERAQILEIHCKKRNVDITQFSKEEWEKLIAITHRYVGAELEHIVCDARFTAFAARQAGQPTVGEMIAAARSIIPIAVSDMENMLQIKKLCEGRAVPVSRRKEVTMVKQTRSVSI